MQNWCNTHFCLQKILLQYVGKLLKIVWQTSAIVNFSQELCQNSSQKKYKNSLQKMCKNCLQNDVQEHSADGQEQKKFLEIGKSCKADFLKISFGKYF